MKSSDPHCSILLVGTELTEGRIHDTNGCFLASQMRGLGISVVEIVSVPDDLGLITGALQRLVSTSDIVLVSGGLGPTSDDITRDGVAAVLGEDLEMRQECIDHLKARVSFDHAWEANSRQAMIPKGASVFLNPNGTACGFWEENHALLFCLPGPPRELKPMFTDQVAPLIEAGFRRMERSLLYCSAFLVPESFLEDALVRANVPGVSWSTRVEEYRIAVTLRGKATTDLERVYSFVENYFGSPRIVRGETEAALLLSEALKAAGKTVVAAESCTGGLVAKLLTDAAGSSDTFCGSFVTYRDEIKHRWLNIEKPLLEGCGAVSGEVASAMCSQALEASGADLAVSVTGYAGPAAGGDAAPVGTVWICAQRRGWDPQPRQFKLRGDRDRIRRMAAVAAILYAKTILENPGRLDSNENWGYI